MVQNILGIYTDWSWQFVHGLAISVSTAAISFHRRLPNVLKPLTTNGHSDSAHGQREEDNERTALLA
jgi:hypothetical protein